ncbi:MAG: TPM domain-containing protein [Bacteroidales bacterium]|nr:TPM domain-containing protein [Bacteroidales bacterium]
MAENNSIGKKIGCGCLSLIGAFLLLCIIVAIFDDEENTSQQDTNQYQTYKNSYYQYLENFGNMNENSDSINIVQNQFVNNNIEIDTLENLVINHNIDSSFNYIIGQRTETDLKVNTNVVSTNNTNSILTTPYVDTKYKIYDFANKLSTQQRIYLQMVCDTFIAKTKLDIAVVILNQNYEKPTTNGWNKTEAYIQDFYDYNNFGLDGVMLAIDIANNRNSIFDVGIPYSYDFMGNKLNYYGSNMRPLFDNQKYFDEIYWFIKQVENDYIPPMPNYYEHILAQRTNDNLYNHKDFGYYENFVRDLKHEPKFHIMNTPYVDPKEKIYDFAKLFTDEQKAELKQKIDSFITKTNIDFVYVSVNELKTEPIDNFSPLESYAMNFYDYNDFGLDSLHSGFICIFDHYSYKIKILGMGLMAMSDVMSNTDLWNVYIANDRYKEISLTIECLYNEINNNMNLKNKNEYKHLLNTNQISELTISPSKIDIIEIANNNKKLTPIVDTSYKIYDFANILTEEQEQEIEKRCKEFINNSGIDLAIVTTNENYHFKNQYGRQAENYIANFYNNNNFKKDCVMVLLDIQNGKTVLIDRGRPLKGNLVYDLENDFTEYLVLFKQKQYYEEIIYLIEHIDYQWKDIISFPFWKFLIISLIFGYIAMNNKRKEYILVKNANTAFNYQKNHKLTLKTTNLLSSNTTKTYSPPHTSSSGGGGYHSSSGSSGRGHSGGSF